MLYLPIGPPACGKSYLTQLMIESGTLDPDAVVSPDYYRRVLTGDVSRQFENSVAFSICHKIADARLRNSLDVWVDATNLQAAWFAQHVDAANRTNTSIVTILFETPIEECERRNNERPKPVPQEIMDSMFGHYRNINRDDLPGTLISATDVLESLADRTRWYDSMNTQTNL